MNWNAGCFLTLDARKVFENSGHRTRFAELLECYSEYPFFTKGLCKCMYLAAWDEEHFLVMLQTLTDMALGREQNTDDMRIQGDMMADENADANAVGEAFIYQMSSAFLEGRKIDLKDVDKLPKEYQYIVRRGLEVSKLIDEL